MSFANRGPPAAFSRRLLIAEAPINTQLFGDSNIMTRFIFRASLLAILLAGLAGLPASAQTTIPAGKDHRAAAPGSAPATIPAGKDFWTTPANGLTFFTFPAGDVESLCGASPSDDWDHKLVLKGVPLSSGPAYDTVVARLNDAVFDSTGTAKVPIQVVELHFASADEGQDTPCGFVTWEVELAGAQGSTTMVLHRTSSHGGYFNADLILKVELKAFKDGLYLGSLFYDFKLPDPSSGGTPWSFGTAGEFRAGMTETDNCIAVLRQKLSLYTTDSSHYYYISDLIAQGKCKERP
jgi:hypothetical protein